MGGSRLGARLAVGVALAVMVAAGSAAVSHGADSPADGSGADIYARNCAGCHGAEMGGSGGPAIGPALRGKDFLARWGTAPAVQFLAYVHDTMPLNAPGSLDRASSREAANFVLAANGLPIAQGLSIPGSAASGSASSADTPQISVASFTTASEPSDGGIPNTNPAEDLDGPFRAAMAERAALIGAIGPVDDQGLANPAPQDWLSWRGNSATQGHSALTQIDRSNVGGLNLAWGLALPPGTNAIAPLVHDGVMFINSNGVVQALDARNGDPIWKFSRVSTVAARVPASQPRGIALYGGTLFVPTGDAHLLALDAKTGKLLWDHGVGEPQDGLQMTAAPLVARGKVIQGISGCQGSVYGGGCFILALDAKTGKEAWRFYTIARPGEPGGDSWNGAALDKRYGGSVWNTGSYDPALNLLFFGVGQTYTLSTLLEPQGRKGKSDDALFTNSTLAIDPDNGKLVWHFQHVPADVWDLDWSYERTIATIDGRKVIVTAGKTGIFDALDAKTGRYLWSRDLGHQNLIIAIDPKTGRKTNDPKLRPEAGQPKLVCPSAIGVRNWMTTAYDPATAMLYVPATSTCMDYSRNADPDGPASQGYGELRVVRRRPPNSDGLFGMLTAIDVGTGKIAWTTKRRTPPSSAILTTATGLVFEGSRDRSFRAVDGRNGDILWQTRLPAVPNAFPFSYAIGGVQYVAVVAGGGTPVDAFDTAMTPEYPASNGAKSIMVFALPGRY